MAAHLPQPNMQVITDSARTILDEMPRLANIPAIQEANAILGAINALGERMDARLNAIETNSFARTCNSSCQHPNDVLVPLVDANNQEIANFPETIADLNALSDANIIAILVALGRPINGDVHQRHGRLLLSIGITFLAVNGTR